ncbi:PREDICTED: GDP-D-glucose phosphorylase 1 [Papilio polytes]|uniref:GDP-D-glucose phosphorylase 1 n=1 Tax=Papilio polytes TaxID=76194 RepID=UPI000676028E|nr:PREDICTED: GDP-D-glucose phosphorylase 1 [Papilio polytes]
MSKSRIQIGRNVNVDFIQLYKSTWDKIHRETDVFRYKVENLRERIVNEKYLLQLNPDRSIKRRTPEQIDNICQPFDENKFNFTKASKDETMFSISDENDLNEHFLLVNVSPISQYHSLLCPSMYKCLPQVVTKDSLQLMLDIMCCSKDRDIRIGFNSLCGLASVNHLHYHIFIEKNILPVETVKCKHLKGPVYILDGYPVPGFCFEITRNTINSSEYIYKLIDLLLKKCIAHNIFITRGQSVSGDGGIVRVIVWPRKNSSGAKQLAAFNVAVCELSGWFPVYG